MVIAIDFAKDNRILILASSEIDGQGVDSGLLKCFNENIPYC